MLAKKWNKFIPTPEGLHMLAGNEIRSFQPEEVKHVCKNASPSPLPRRGYTCYQQNPTPYLLSPKVLFIDT
jgi:hypothetical protein